jgi:O-antigen ligase
MPLALMSREHRLLDLALLMMLGMIVLQMVPLPESLVSAWSPNAIAVQNRLQLAVDPSTRTLSIDAALTRAGLASVASALLVFWAARDSFGRGGVRTAVRTIAFGGFALAVVGVAQRATAPETLLWWWQPLDPGAKPIGPFVSRNDFAAWLLLASAVTVGYTVLHVRTHGLLTHRSARIAMTRVLADGTGLILAGAAAIMLLTLTWALSRGALLGAAASVVCGYLFTRQRSIGRGRGATAGVILLLGLLLVGIWINVGALATRLAGGTEASRATIWRETLPILTDFPIAGTGIGTYPRAMLIYQRTTPDVLFNHAHSEYLQLVAEGGLMVTVPAIVALAAWLALARRRIRDDHREILWIRLASAAGIAGIAVQCVWDATLRMPATAILVALLAALVVHDHRQETERLEA